MRIAMMAVLLATSAASLAADLPPPRITVSGAGSVRTPPDIATIDYSVRGEGASSDAAVGALVAKRKRIDAGLAAYGVPVEVRTSRVTVNEVRGKDCQRYGPPQLSVGECTILGYVADMAVTIRTPQVTKAGTIVGLIGRLEGSTPTISGFSLADPKLAQRRAIAAALADARDKAEAIAAGTASHLGKIAFVNNQSQDFRANDIVVSGSRAAPPAPPPPPPPPPIAVDLTPQPIETNAQVVVSYDIAP